MGLAVPIDAGEHAPVAGAMCTLLRWRCIQAGDETWKDLNASIIESAIISGLAMIDTAPRFSFASAIRGLDIVPQFGLHPALYRCGIGNHRCPCGDREAANMWRLDLIVTCPRSRIMLKLALAHKVPVAVGISITERWTDAADVATGIMRMPELDAIPVDGDCVVLDGWDDERCAFSCWFMAGPDWGDAGRGWIPYEYVGSPIWCHELVMMPTI